MTPENPLQELPLPPPPKPEPAWNVFDVLLILIAAVVASALARAGGFAIARAVPGFQQLTREQFASNPIFIIPVQFAVYLVTFIFARMLITVRAQQDFWVAVKWNFPAPANAVTYVFAGVVMAFAAQIAGHFLPIPKSLPVDRYFRQPGFAYMMLAFGVLVAPLVEEILFRGLIFPLLARATGVISGTIITALLFSLVHQSQLAQAWAPLLVIFGVGLVLTTIRARANSLAASWIVHLSYNATLFAVLFYFTGGFHNLERLAE
jgi:membrane protease YdiL (CAAX protease family)